MWVFTLLIRSPLHFRLTAAAPYFPLMLTHYTLFPRSPASTLERFNAVANRGTAWTRPANFVGNGPFPSHRVAPQPADLRGT